MLGSFYCARVPFLQEPPPILFNADRSAYEIFFLQTHFVRTLQLPQHSSNRGRLIGILVASRLVLWGLCKSRPHDLNMLLEMDAY